MDLYWQINLLLGRTLLDRHEHQTNVLHSLEYLHRHLRDLDQHMERIEQHLGIPYEISTIAITRYCQARSNSIKTNTFIRLTSYLIYFFQRKNQ